MKYQKLLYLHIIIAMSLLSKFQIMKSLQTQFANTDLPVVQKNFINQFDGTIENILNFPKLNLILNPTFTGHFFYVSGDTMENTVTTRDTDGSYAMWGNQSKEAEHNAFLLSQELKKIFKEQELFFMKRSDVQEFSPYNAKENWNKRKLFISLNGQMKRISGLTTFNIGQ